MLVEKKTFGTASPGGGVAGPLLHTPLWSKASISVPGAPASSGLTWSHPAAVRSKAGVEMRPPGWLAVALLCTCQPPRPRVTNPGAAEDADADPAPRNRRASAAAQTGSSPLATRTPDLITAPSPKCRRGAFWQKALQIILPFARGAIKPTDLGRGGGPQRGTRRPRWLAY